jgi:hypothetical protein
MADSESSLKTLIDKVADFFDIFDLSFFVAGACFCFGIWIFLYLNKLVPDLDLPKDLSFFFLIISFYVCGFICFCIGRMFRRSIHDRYEYFSKVMNAYDFPSNNRLKKLSDYKSKLGRPYLYVYLHVRLRESKYLVSSLPYVKRYWAMAALCDGLSVAIWSWPISLFLNSIVNKCMCQCTYPFYLLFVFLIFSFLHYVLYKEANRYEDYQCDELVASLTIENEMKKQ